MASQQKLGLRSDGRSGSSGDHHSRPFADGADLIELRQRVVARPGQGLTQPVFGEIVMESRLLSIVLTGLVAVAGCEPQSTAPPTEKVTPADLREDAGKLAETAAKFAKQTKDEFQQKLDARLKDLDSEIAALKEKGSELKDEAKVKWDQKMADLEVKREAARAKLSELANSSGEAWKDLQKGAQSAWDDLDKSFKEASDEF